MPAPTPVTTPEELIVATPVVILLHVPPGVASLSGVVRPLQTDNVPVIALTTGATSTETMAVATAVPQAFVTV